MQHLYIYIYIYIYMYVYECTHTIYIDLYISGICTYCIEIHVVYINASSSMEVYVCHIYLCSMHARYDVYTAYIYLCSMEVLYRCIRHVYLYSMEKVYDIYVRHIMHTTKIHMSCITSAAGTYMS